MSNGIILKKGLKLGELDAEADTELLKACFVDNGNLNRLLNMNDPASIVLGRTGSGKSALLLQVKERSEHACLLSPHDISIQYLENSNIIQFLIELKIKLDLFYRILWRHIFIVEFLKMRYDLRDEIESKNFLSRFFSSISRNRIEKKAFEYFSEWSDKFWLEVDEQLRELTKKFTRDIKSSLGSKYKEIDISLEGAKSLSTEERIEIATRAKKVVNEIQIQRLNEVFDLLADHAFSDRQKNYYILIDQLDEEWAETETRLRFIRALIEEIKSFRKLPQVKVLIALRQDLLDSVFNRTRGAGFQQEKYEAYSLTLKWTKKELEELIELRIKEVFKRQYTKENVKFLDIFPSQKDKNKKNKNHIEVTAIEYIISRSLLRPRDVLQYVNECLVIAEKHEKVSWTHIYDAEAIYSYKRLKSLEEEWENIYPALKDSVEVLRGLQSTFTRNDINIKILENVCVSLDDKHPHDPCVDACKKLYSPDEENTTEADVLLSGSRVRNIRGTYV